MKIKINLARLAFMALVIVGLAGCGGGGDGGVAVAPGGGAGAGTGGAAPPAPVPPGNAPVNIANLTAEQLAALQPQIVFGGAAVASPPEVTFAIQDQNGNPIIGMGVMRDRTPPDLEHLRFSIAKLVPGAPVAGTAATTPSKWVSYIVLGSDGNGGRPTAERTGTLTDNGDGTYAYTFSTDIATVGDDLAAATAPNGDVADLGDLTYDATMTHRLVIQLSSGGITNPVNAVYDFIPATGSQVTDTDFQRQVVSIDNCNECHNKLAIHGSNRIDTQYCVVCHTDQRKFGRDDVASTAGAFPALTETVETDPDTGYKEYDYDPRVYVGDGETMGDFPRMVHKIHRGHNLTKQNYNYANLPFNLLGYSMLDEGERMCTKCHKGDVAQVDNWSAVPSTIACGACHDGVNFASGTGHVGGAQPDTRCALCHDGTNIPVYHQTENVTEHNPTIAPGLVTFAYEIVSADVDGANDLTIQFKIKQDGVDLDSLPPAGTSTRVPGFLLAWAEPQNGIATPADFNNLTRRNAQPKSVSVASAATATDGVFTQVIPSADAFPPGATLRTVGIQGYYQQVVDGSNVGRHAISAVKTVTGDTERRSVIDAAKCANCHEWFEGHGGNRVIGKETEGLAVCTTCHVPGITSTGRTLLDSEVNGYGWSAGDLMKLTEWGLDTAFPVTTGDTWAIGMPVTTNNLKDMIHGIHKGRERVEPFRDARNALTRAITLLDFGRLNFPGIINECETCHLPGSYSSVPANALASTYEYVDAAYKATPNAVNAEVALSGASNPEDIVTSPFAASCVSCHDGSTAKVHMGQNGGQIMVERQALSPPGTETCALCHGANSTVANITEVHSR